MARQLGFKDVLASYEGAATQLGSTLILQEQNRAELKANGRERRCYMREWRTRKNSDEHVFFFKVTQRRRQQIIFEGMKLEELVSNLRKEIRETRRKLQKPQSPGSSGSLAAEPTGFDCCSC